jgi:hypothetical protein
VAVVEHVVRKPRQLRQGQSISGCRARCCPRPFKIRVSSRKTGEPRPILPTRCYARSDKRDQAGALCFSSIKVPAAVAGSRNTIGRPLAPIIGSPEPSTRTPDALNRLHIAFRSSTR